MPKPYFSKKQRKTIHEHAKFRCEYCQILEAFVESFVNEHINPQSLGGSSKLNNIANACNICNGHKYNKTTGFDALTRTEVSLFHPRKDN